MKLKGTRSKLLLHYYLLIKRLNPELALALLQTLRTHPPNLTQPIISYRMHQYQSY